MLEGGGAENCQLITAFRNQGCEERKLTSSIAMQKTWGEGVVAVPGKKDVQAPGLASPHCNSKVKWVGRGRGVLHAFPL